MDSVVIVKVISALAYPAGLAATLVLIGVMFRIFGAKRLSGLCMLFTALVLIIASNPKFARFLTSQLEQRHPQTALNELRKHDAVIVLGGGLKIPLPPAQHTQIGKGSDRFWYAVRLHRAGLADKVILTGGNVYAQPNYASEAEYAAELLQEWGVPASAILIEKGSRTTRQNQEKTGVLLVEHNIKSALLVTSAIHMPRAYALFSELPIEITPASADVLIRKHNSPPILDWIPSVSALYLSTVALHEYYGIVFDEFRSAMK